MSSTPSDEWLLALLDEKLPEELTPAEFAALRERAAASPSVRKAILERVRFEEALHAAFGNPVVSVEKIVELSRRGKRRRWLVPALAALLLAAVGGTWWLVSRSEDEPPVPRNVAATDSTKTKEEEPQPAPPQTGPRSAIVPVEAPRPAVAAEIANTPAPQAPTPAAQPNRWEALLGENAPVVPFADSATAQFGQTVPGYDLADEFPPAELGQWIERVGDKPFEITSGQWRGQRFGGLQGIARLLPPWRQDSVLRIAPFDVHEFAVHLWRGTQGVTLRFYPHQRPQLLAAYETKREDNEPLPQVVRLLASDGGSYSRSNAGAIELRHQDGRLVVTRGMTPILVVPMPSPPAEVFLQGRMQLRTLAMHRGEVVPLPAEIAGRNLLDETPLDERNWLTSEEPQPVIEKQAGRVTLSAPGEAAKSRQIVWGALPVPNEAPTGLCEAIFRIESLTPGSGLYLGDATGRPVHTLFASEDAKAAATLLAYGWTSRNGSVPEPHWQWDRDPEIELTPAVAAGSWVKVLVGPGGLKVSFSGDGEHWGPASITRGKESVRGGFASVGLFAFADGKPREISVSNILVRELPGIAALASDELRRQVPPIEATAPERPGERPADWLTWVTATRPPEVPFADWLRACGIETLARGCSVELSATVIDGLVGEGIAAERPAAEVLALLRDAATLSDYPRTAELIKHYDNLARRIVVRGGEPETVAAELAAVVDGYLTAPLWSDARQPALPPAVVRNVAALASWFPQAAAVAAQSAAILTPAHPEGGWTSVEESGLARLVSWSAATAKGSSRRLDGTVRLGWQHPLATEPGREEMTLAAELDAALAAGAFDDAAGLFPALTQLPGLLPALNDPERYVPAAGLVSETARRYPQLVATLTERTGPAGSLLVREAAAAGDEEAMRAAAVRFYGTPAASEARRWLGEAALASGQFLEAQGHFTAALASAPEAERAALTARRRLAAALAGQESDQPVSEAISLGSRMIDAADFERLVGELRQARSTSASEQSPPLVIPEPSAIAPQARGRFDGDVGRSPGRPEFQRFDWAGRQIGMAVDRGVFYFTNRFQVVAFDPQRKLTWWTIGLGNEQGETHAFPNTAFTPVIRGDRLFVRRLTGRGPELACQAVSAGGKVLWRSSSDLAIVSDPFFHGDRLFAITTPFTFRGGELATLSLTQFRDEDGSIVDSEPLLILHSTEAARPTAGVTPTGDGFLMQTCGTLAYCGRNGSLAWVRRLPHLPASADFDRDRLAPDPPLLVGERVYAALPGSRAVVCLDAGTGELLWTRPLGELTRLHGPAGPVIAVLCETALLGLDPDSGATRWRFEQSDLLDGLLADEKTLLATARTELPEGMDGLSFLWIDAATGRLQSEQVTRVQRTDGLLCGPLFVHDGTVWGFVGESWRDAKRSLVEFAADASLPAARPAALPGSLAHWRSHVSAQTDLNVAAVLPGWTAIGTQSKEGTRFRDEHLGERWVLETEADRTREARFVKQIKLDGEHPKLTARVGRNDDAGWILRLFIDGQPFTTEPINKQTAPDGWRTVTFDLAQHSGKEVLLTIDQASPDEGKKKETKAFWKTLGLE